jgi:hypothetical protein
VQIIGNRQPHVEADQVAHLERPHGVTVTERHRFVDVGGAGDLLLQHPHRLEPERDAQP